MLFRNPDAFQALFDFQRALDQMRSSDWLQGQTATIGTFPTINIFRQADDYVAIIELPGVNKDDIEIEAKDNVIRLKGKKEANYPEGVSAHRRERVFGSFDRTISVPVRIDANRVKAEYRDGILALYIPRAEEDKPKKVTVG
jgi:HSP20 family protein